MEIFASQKFPIRQIWETFCNLFSFFRKLKIFKFFFCLYVSRFFFSRVKKREKFHDFQRVGRSSRAKRAICWICRKFIFTTFLTFPWVF